MSEAPALTIAPGAIGSANFFEVSYKFKTTDGSLVEHKIITDSVRIIPGLKSVPFSLSEPILPHRFNIFNI